MDVFVVSPSLSFINCTFPHQSSVSDLIELFSPGKGISCLDLYVKKNGRLSGGDERLQAGAVYRLEPRLCGGKGGFGSMLRALGAQIEKTTNREACRDLSGRRLRDVNHEKEMAEWLKNQTDRDAEKEQRRLEKIRRKLAKPKRTFVDPEFDQQCHDLSERLEDSVLKGMQASSSGMVQAEDKPCCRKRPATKASAMSVPHSKKNCFWSGLEGVGDMDSTDEESDESEAEGFPVSSSFASTSSAAGPSSISQPAAVPTSTAREQEKVQSWGRSCSSSSSSAGSAPCSPPPSQENAEEKEERVETAREEERVETAREEERVETAREEERVETAREEERVETAREEERVETAREEERVETAREEERVETAREEERVETAREEERVETAREEERVETAREEERVETAREEERVETAREEERVETAREEERVETAREEERVETAREEERVETAQKEKENTHVESVDPQKVQPEDADTPLDLLSVSRAEELEAAGLERLKAELMKRGMKCGGTLQERATRLFSVRGLGADQIDPALLAKPSKGKKK